MPLISEHELATISEKIEAGKKSLARFKDRAKESTGRIMHQGEAAGVAFLSGYYRGRQPEKFEKGIFGQAPDLVAAAVLDGAVMLGYGGGIEEHLFAGATGALCGYTAALGMKRGAAAAVVAKEKAGPYLGDPEVGATIAAEGAQSATTKEIASLMEQLRALRAA